MTPRRPTHQTHELHVRAWVKILIEHLDGPVDVDVKARNRHHQRLAYTLVTKRGYIQPVIATNRATNRPKQTELSYEGRRALAHALGTMADALSRAGFRVAPPPPEQCSPSMANMLAALASLSQLFTSDASTGA